MTIEIYKSTTKTNTGKTTHSIKINSNGTAIYLPITKKEYDSWLKLNPKEVLKGHGLNKHSLTF